MPDYVSDGNGSWFDVSLSTRLSVESGGMTRASAISGLNADQEV